MSEDKREPMKIPEFHEIECPTCHRRSVAEVGRKVICETCVNAFLAKNVGLMQPVVVPPLKAGLTEGVLMPKEN